MKKVILTICLSCIFCFYGFSQDNNNVEEEIELPDVTTVVSGGALTAGKDSVPDYKGVIPTIESAKVELPKLSNSDDVENISNVSNSIQNIEKSVYAEGKAGGGYPFYFLGDFSVYRTTGTSPFSINFSHESAEGFADNSAANGFFERNTFVSANKSFNLKNGKNELYGSYNSANNGLQSLSPSFVDIVYHNVAAGFSSDWKLNNNFSVYYGTDGSWFNRYNGIFLDSAISSKSYEKDSKLFDINPWLGIKWEKDNFEIDFTANYSLELNLKDSKTLLKANGSSSEESSHRGEFDLSFVWKNEVSKLKSNVAAIIGTAIGEKKDIIVPFSVGMELALPNSFSSRKISLELEGGMDSYSEKIRDLETKYKYSVATSLLTETTDWYGFGKISLPIKEFFGLRLSGEYRKTAYDNGVWWSDYSNKSSSGLYFITNNNREDFNTETEVNFVLGNVKLSGLWKAYWLDVPCCQDEHNIYATVQYQSKNTNWDLGGSISKGLGDNAEFIPNISADATFRISHSIRIAFELNDIIKLIKNETRSYANSDYVEKGGSAALLVKFQF